MPATGSRAQEPSDGASTLRSTRCYIQPEINLARRFRHSGNLGYPFGTVDIPAMAVETVESGVVATRHEAGVGKIDRQLPVMMTKAIDINFNPYWTVPAFADQERA